MLSLLIFPVPLFPLFPHVMAMVVHVTTLCCRFNGEWSHPFAGGFECRKSGRGGNFGTRMACTPFRHQVALQSISRQIVSGPRMTKLNVIWWNHMKIPWLEIPGAAKHCQFAWLVVVRSVEVTTSNGARVSGKARTGWCRHECKICEIE